MAHQLSWPHSAFASQLFELVPIAPGAAVVSIFALAVCVLVGRAQGACLRHEFVHMAVRWCALQFLLPYGLVSIAIGRTLAIGRPRCDR